ncbi:MAG: tRNA (guanosine(37)-N1)-methyltransferase TrmD [Ignavibacteriae bacterium]|nr:tRNA (guanosine(37)-N1)-methyltransferase TrmD [Ignavibacteriota bacterium]
MRLDIITALPEMFNSVFNSSIIKIAKKKKLVKIKLHNLHDYAKDKFRHIDDTPYGGGAGMLIKCEPVFECIEKLKSKRDYDQVIYLTADGEKFNQSIANELSLCRNIILIAGHYKGIDQRIRDVLVTREISVGDYVLSGGEIPVMLLSDSIIRLIPGVIGSADSALDDSFQDGLLEPPYYTKPAVFRGNKVPDVLLSGNAKKIGEWKEEQAINKTNIRRPELLENIN